MFTPSSLSIALLMMITSAVCWGSWANTYKGVKGFRFELFYWDYAIGIFLISLVLALTMGSTGNDDSQLPAQRSLGGSLPISSMRLSAELLFNLANLLLVAAIDHGWTSGRISYFNRNNAGGWNGVELRILQPKGQRHLPYHWRRLRIHCRAL